MRRPRLALLIALGALAAPSSALAVEPIEGTWDFAGGQVLVQPATGGGFEGTVVRATQFGECAHRVGERMWQLDGSGASYTGVHRWFVEGDCAAEQSSGRATWRVRETGERFVLDFCTAKPGQGDPTPETSSTTVCSTLDRVKPPTPAGAGADDPRTVCSGPACLGGPAGLRAPGCLRRGDFTYAFPLRLKAAERRRLIVTGARFTLDWKPNGIDRRSPFVARVRGSTLAPGRHLLLADVRLRSRRSGKSLHRRLQLQFDGCK